MKGKLFLVSVGPGKTDLIPPAAEKALRGSDAIVGYDLYLRWIQPWIEGKETFTPPLTQERERARQSIDLAREGRIVSLVSSGDIGIYAMAALVFDLLRPEDEFKTEVIPGISAANACASLLGAPLSHDFATLSLSDLLCPWEWIEKRADHLAQADYAVAMYNVQSRSRAEGVYKILGIMLKSKSPETWCGIVRNAYREDQATEVRQLKDLPGKRFDMLTCVIIGNRFTRLNGPYLFTPRGYEGWGIEKSAEPEVPKNAVWIFSGTSDGNHLAEKIAESGTPVAISAATEYGAKIARDRIPGVAVVTGKKGVETRRKLLRESKARYVVDATHPFATEISRGLIELSRELNIPYLRYERSPQPTPETAVVCSDFRAAAQAAINNGKRIFLATGSKELSIFLEGEEDSEREWFLRLPPDSAMLDRALTLGISRENICLMQGPFSREINETLWKQWNIDCVVTKESGAEGGFEAKVRAAESLGVRLIVVKRPEIEYPRSLSSFSEIVEAIA